VHNLLIFIAAGAFSGVMAGLFGVGGGLILVPILAVVLPHGGLSPDLAMHTAIGTSLAVVAMTSLSSARAHHRRDGVRWDVLKAFAPGLALGAVIGAIVAGHLSAASLRLAIGIGALAIALRMLLAGAPKVVSGRPVPSMPELFGVGGLIGAASSLIGIGGGSLTVPYLSMRGIEMRQAVGTSAAGGVPIAWAGAAAYMVTGMGQPDIPAGQIGYVSLSGFAMLAVASVATAPLGAWLAHRLPPVMLKRAFALLLIGVALKMIAG